MGSNKSTILNYIIKFEFKEIESVIFTTFNFNKEFFDNNILPAVLKVQSTKNIKALKHLTNIELTKIPVAIFYDANQSITDSASYRYQIKAIKLDNGFFHTKNIIICGKDKEDSSLVICTVSSANLTKSAYASNIEVFSHIEIRNQNENSENLLKFVKHLKEISTDEENKITAIDKTIEFLETRIGRKVVKSNETIKFIYDKLNEPYGILNEFISKNVQSNLTLVSPYWTKEMISKLPIGKNNVAIIANDNGKFTISQNGLTELKKKEYEVYESIIQDSGKLIRFLHSKLYMVKDKNMARFALGSSNFTSAGLGISGTNIESMLFFEEKIDNEFELLPYLKPITEIPTDDSKFMDKSDVPMHIPFEISVVLDWSDEKKYYVKIDNTEMIKELHLPGIEIITNFDKINNPIIIDKKDFNIHSNIFIVKYLMDDEIQEYTGFILEINLERSQREYFHRFSFTEILDSWIKPQTNISNYLSDEIDESEEFNDQDNFNKNNYEKSQDIIDNYYEIYRAFNEFRKLLNKTTVSKDIEYLIISGPTSLLKFYESIIPTNKEKESGSELSKLATNNIDLVFKYIVLLEIEDILKYEKTNSLKNNFNLLSEQITEIEGELVKSIDINQDIAEKKIQWFKEMIFKQFTKEEMTNE